MICSAPKFSCETRENEGMNNINLCVQDKRQYVLNSHGQGG